MSNYNLEISSDLVHNLYQDRNFRNPKKMNRNSLGMMVNEEGGLLAVSIGINGEV